VSTVRLNASVIFRFAWCLLALTPSVCQQDIDSRDRAFWNGKFGNSATAFNRSPSRLLVEAIRGRKPGAALDLGMGQGRNAIYLAQQGWQTAGVDLSDVAVRQANERALQLGLRLNGIVDSLDHFDIGKNRWDLIALFYVHAWYNGTRPASTRRIVEGLRPGGLVVMEGFAGKETFMFQPNELLRDFGELKILRYEDLEDEADWAPGRKSHIIRLVAAKS
jgi:SAM-dependent methyltransferase